MSDLAEPITARIAFGTLKRAAELNFKWVMSGLKSKQTDPAIEQGKADTRQLMFESLQQIVLQLELWEGTHYIVLDNDVAVLELDGNRRIIRYDYAPGVWVHCLKCCVPYRSE